MLCPIRWGSKNGPDEIGAVRVSEGVRRLNVYAVDTRCDVVEHVSPL